MMNEELFIIPCPPIKDYPVPPKDQSICTEIKCTECDNLMWFSRKKKNLMHNVCGKSDVLLVCYECVSDIAQENPEIMKQMKSVKL